jgi:hypothetical protein
MANFLSGREGCKRLRRGETRMADAKVVGQLDPAIANAVSCRPLTYPLPPH